MKPVRRVVLLAIAMVMTLIPAAPGVGATGDPVLINEVLQSTAGTDVEYIELFGTPGASLEGVSLIAVEAEGLTVGRIDDRFDFEAGDTLGDNGFYLWGTSTRLQDVYGVTPNRDFPENTLENSATTFALVETASITGTTVTGSETVLDAVATIQNAGTFYFGAPVIGPDGTFLPAGVRRAVDGVDTDAAADWVISDFSLGSDNTPTPGTGIEPPDPEPELTKIHDIQGSGAESPLLGERVIIEGIVVGDFETFDNYAGFLVQEEDDQVDFSPDTSEGIFVFNFSADTVSVGDLVRVEGTVDERRGNSSDTVTNTQLTDFVEVEVLSSGNPLPSASVITFPLVSTTDLESVEGMRTRFPQDLTITEYFNFDRFNEVVIGLPPLGLDRFFQPTAVFEPGSPGAAGLADLYARSTVTLDDTRTASNPDPAIHPGNGLEFDLSNTFRGGDLVQGVEGTIYHSFGVYRILPTEYGAYTAVNDRPDSPQDVGGSLTVATFNVLNYFNTLDYPFGDPRDNACGPAQDQGCRGADDENERTRQLAKIVSAMSVMDADVLGIIEVENTTGVEAMADIVGGLNDIAGPGTYAYVDTGTVGDDAIKVGFIYQPGSVTPVGDFAVLDDPAFVAPFGVDRNRAALAQTFVENATGGKFTAVVNHFKSKGSPCGPGDDDPETGSCNLTRTVSAQVLADWLATDPTGSGDPDVMIIGDLNSYDKEDPIDVLKAAGYADLLFDYQGEYAYSYLFGGQLGYLDYGMANASLASQVTGAAAWAINADEPDLLDYDTSFKQDAQDAIYAPDAYRSSDHDPVIVGLDLNASPVCDAAEPSTASIWPPNHKMVDIEILGCTDADGDAITITIDSIFQDEPVNADDDGNTAPDGAGIGTSIAQVRAERSGEGDGRVYHIGFTATDAFGNTTTGEVTVEVRLSRKQPAIDGGALYDSTIVP